MDVVPTRDSITPWKTRQTAREEASPGMTIPRYSVLLIGSAPRRQWLRQLLPSGAMVVEAEAEGVRQKLSAVTFDLVLADSPDSELLLDTEQMLSWKREYLDVPRFYFVARGSVAPPVQRRVFVLEQPVSEKIIRSSLERLIAQRPTAPMFEAASA